MDSLARLNCHPSRRRGWQTRDVGWPIFLPWSVYYFSQLGHEIGPFSRVKVGENFAFQAYFVKVVRNIHVYPKTGEK